MELYFSEHHTCISFICFLILILLILIDRVQKLKRENKQLKETNALNKEALTVFSHDVKECLIVIRELSKDAISGKVDLATICESIDLQTRSVTTVIDNIFQWANMELQPNVTVYSKEPLHRQVNWIIESLKIKCRIKRIKITNTVPTNIYWNINYCVLDIALRNLISNSVKFSEPESEIVITYLNNKLIVSDCGTGIPPKSLHSLFERKLRAYHGTNGEKGYGLGLLVIYNILKRHGFKLEAANKVSRGAVFSIKNHKKHNNV